MERDDIGYSNLERFMIAMKRVIEPVELARDDYDIFSSLAARLGVADTFTEGRTSQEWLRKIYTECRDTAAIEAGLPDFDVFWERELTDMCPIPVPVVMLEAFRKDPGLHPLATPSGLIELYSGKLASVGYADCQGHAKWFEPVEWLGSSKARQFPLHLLTDQPFNKLHSQFDHGHLSRDNKIKGREPILVNPEDAKLRGIEDGEIVRVYNARGECLAAARISDQLRPGVVKLSTGA